MLLKPSGVSAVEEVTQELPGSPGVQLPVRGVTDRVPLLGAQLFAVPLDGSPQLRNPLAKLTIASLALLSVL